MATRTRYAPDRGLTVRMTATMFLLGLVFVAFVALIIGIMTRRAREQRPRSSSSRWSSAAARRSSRCSTATRSRWPRRARARSSPQEAPELHGIVDRLCALADMDKPRVAIAPARMPNAFATGRNSKNSVLCVTEGLLHQARPDESSRASSRTS